MPVRFDSGFGVGLRTNRGHLSSWPPVAQLALSLPRLIGLFDFAPWIRAARVRGELAGAQRGGHRDLQTALVDPEDAAVRV